MAYIIWSGILQHQKLTTQSNTQEHNQLPTHRSILVAQLVEDDVYLIPEVGADCVDKDSEDWLHF